MRPDKAMLALKLLVTLAILVAIICLAADAMSEVLDVRLVQASGGLNVRKEPCIESRPIYLLEDCETVVVLDEQNGWALVGKNTPPHGAIGWVCVDYLD